MKKYLPIAIFVLGLVVLVGGGIFVLSRRGGSGGEDEEAFLRDIPLSERPFTSLTPSEDGHWLNMVIDAIKVADAKTLDYELAYKVPDGRTQGVPGKVPLGGQNKIERKLLLGSESSGKFRYDEGVEEGTLTLRLRNDQGKLIGKLVTSFHLQKDVKELTSIDGKFKYTLDEEPKDTFFVTMSTFGLPEAVGEVLDGPFGMFASKSGPYPGRYDFVGSSSYNPRYYGGKGWGEPYEKPRSTDIGVFVALSNQPIFD